MRQRQQTRKQQQQLTHDNYSNDEVMINESYCCNDDYFATNTSSSSSDSCDTVQPNAIMMNPSSHSTITTIRRRKQQQQVEYNAKKQIDVDVSLSSSLTQPTDTSDNSILYFPHQQDRRCSKRKIKSTTAFSIQTIIQCSINNVSKQYCNKQIVISIISIIVIIVIVSGCGSRIQHPLSASLPPSFCSYNNNRMMMKMTSIIWKSLSLPSLLFKTNQENDSPTRYIRSMLLSSSSCTLTILSTNKPVVRSTTTTMTMHEQQQSYKTAVVYLDDMQDFVHYNTIQGLEEEEPDYNDLNIDSNADGNYSINSYNNNDMKYHIERDEYLDWIDYMDEDEVDEMKWYDHYDDLDHSSLNCTKPQWSFRIHPTCNDFHDQMNDILSTTNSMEDRSSKQPYIWNVQYLGNGNYRSAWLYQYLKLNSRNDLTNNTDTNERHHENDDDYIMEEEYVIKRLHMYHHHNIRSLQEISNEAYIMEQLTSSGSVTRIYGHCGTATITERGYPITYHIVPSDTTQFTHHPPMMMNQRQPERGRISQRILYELEELYGNPLQFNKYTAEQKLQIVIEMAESIALLHGYRKGTIVHDDVHIDQWLLTKDNRIILNDMNLAQFLQYDRVNQKYCKYLAPFDGVHRAPEQYCNPDSILDGDNDYDDDDDSNHNNTTNDDTNYDICQDNGCYIDESSDMYAFGNVLFSIITGLFPFYNETNQYVIEEMAMLGIKPYLNPLFCTRSFIEKKLCFVMDLCHKLIPENRITIFQVLQYLYETKDEIELN